MDAKGSSKCLNDQLNSVDIKPIKSTIIKQDVMLSGSNNQSLASANISISNISNSSNNNATNITHSNIVNNSNNNNEQSITNHILQNQQAITVENLFSVLQQQQQQQQNNSGNNTEMSKQAELNSQANLLAGLQTLTPTLLTNHQQQQQQQPTNQVTPQLLVANQAALGLAQGGSNPALQHLFIPVSAGNLNQQLLSIPFSLATTNLSNQMHLLTASNGQLIAANMPSQPLTFALPQANTGTPLQPVFMLGSQLGVIMPQLAQSANQNIQNLAFRQLLSQQQQQQNSTNSTTNQTNPTAALINPATNLTQLITNAQGQIVAIGNPQLLQQTFAAVIANSANNAGSNQPAINIANVNNNNTTATNNNSALNSNKLLQQGIKVDTKQLILQTTTSSSTASNTTATTATVASSNQTQMTTKILNSLLSLTPSASDATGTNISSSLSDTNVTSPSKFISQVAQAFLLNPAALAAAANQQKQQQQQQQQQLNTTSPISIFPVTSSTNSPPTSSLASPGLTPNINQLLPNTISSSRELGTIVDGVNLDEMREFAKQFKLRRLSLGLTQTQVGQALSITEGPSYSQSAICRFEKLDITPKSAQKIKPVLERWMTLAEERMKNGGQSLPDYNGFESSKKRKRRTSFTPGAIDTLNDSFDHNPHPTGTEMSELADRLKFDREVIRVWFCNKRQTLKNTIKKIKVPPSPES